MTGLLRAGGKILVIGVVLLLAFAAFSLYVASRVEQPSQTVPLAGTGAAAPPVTVPDDPAQVPSVANPRALAQLRMDEKPGGTCQAAAHVMLQPLVDLDARVIKAGGPGNWLQRDVWIGDIDSAATAFGATWAARSSEDPSEAWVEAERGGRTMAIQLLAVKTSDGTEVWQASGSIAVTSCDPNG